jgi:hypothetical protein
MQLLENLRRPLSTPVSFCNLITAESMVLIMDALICLRWVLTLYTAGYP